MEPTGRITFPPSGDHDPIIRQSFATNSVTSVLGESIAVSFVESLISDLSSYKGGNLDDLSKKKFLQLFSLYPLLSLENKDQFATAYTGSITQLLIVFATSIEKKQLLESFWIAEWDRDAFLMLLRVCSHKKEHQFTSFTKNKSEVSKELRILLRVLKNYHTFMRILLQIHPLDYRFKFEKAETSVLLLSALFNYCLKKGLEDDFTQDLAPHLKVLQECLNELRKEFSTLRERDAAQKAVEDKCWTDLFVRLGISIQSECYQEYSLRTYTIQNIVQQELSSRDDTVALKILTASQQSALAEYALKIITKYCQEYKTIRPASLGDFKKDTAITITWTSKELANTFEELSKFEKAKQKLHKLIKSLRWLTAAIPPKEDERELRVDDPLYLLRKIAKDWAARQQAIVPLGNSINNVYRVEDTQQRTVAYFKSPKISPGQANNPNYTARMEKLVWDLAVFFGCEKYFTPTTLVTIKQRTGLLTGSLQIAQPGASLKEHLAIFQKKEPSDSQDILIEFILTTLLFSPYDAHEHNIISEPLFNPKLFDNTRSLPHSNKVLSWGNKLLSPYRCALLGLPGCFTALSETEKQQLKTWLQRIEERLVNLEHFFEQNAATQKEFPSGWFNRDLTCEALKERFKSALEALNRENLTLVDLVFSVFPYFKFFGLLTLFRLADPYNDSSSMLIDALKDVGSSSMQEFQQKILALTGSACINELIDTCTSDRVKLDPEDLFELSQDTNKSFALLVAEVDKRYREAKKKSWQQEALSKQGHKLKLLFYWMAEIDTKELDPVDDPVTFFDQMGKDCQAIGISFGLDWQKQKTEATLRDWSEDPYKPKFLIAGNSMTTSLRLFWISTNGQNNVIHQTSLKILERDRLCLEIEGTIREMSLLELQRFFS